MKIKMSNKSFMALKLSLIIFIVASIVVGLLAFKQVKSPSLDSFNVKWYSIEDGIIHKEYIVEIQNLEDINKDFNLQIIISNTSFLPEKVSDLYIYEYKGLNQSFPIYDIRVINQTCWYVDNTTKVNTSYDCSYNETYQNSTEYKMKNIWKPTKMLLINNPDKVIADYGLINIPKLNSKPKYDDFGNVETNNGTKTFKVSFNIPIGKTSQGWGSSGLIGIKDLNTGNFYHPWWNATWLNRKLINITNNAAQTLKKYHTINFTMDTSSINCDGLRIVYNDNTELNMTIHNTTLDFIDSGSGCGQTNTEIYFMLQANITSGNYDDTHYFIYYNNDTVVVKYPDDLEKVFLLYDDFNRPDSDTVGNDWVERDTYGTTFDVDICSNMACPQNNNDALDKIFDIGQVVDLTGWEVFTDQYQNAADGYINNWVKNSSDWSGGDCPYYILWDSKEDNSFIVSTIVGGTWINIKKEAYAHTQAAWYKLRWVHYDQNGDFSLWVNGTKQTWDTTNTTDSKSNSTYGLIFDFNRAPSRLDNVMMRRWINTQPSVVLVSEAPANTPPQWSLNATKYSTGQNYSSSTVYGFQVKWNDDIDANGYNFSYFEHNVTGTLTNYTTTRANNVSYYNFTGIPAGGYTIKFYANDSSNAWNSTDKWNYFVNKATTETNLLLDGFDGDKTYNIGTNNNFTVTVDVAGNTVKLDSNFTNWVTPSGITPLYNYTALNTVGTYNFTGYYEGNSNYSASSETHYATIIDFAPTYSLNSTGSIVAGNPVSHNLYLSDNFGLSSFIPSFDNCTGTLVNLTGTSLSDTNSWANFTVGINSTVGCTVRWCEYFNDTSNNWNGSSCVAPFSYVTNTNMTGCSNLNVAGATYYLTANIIDSDAIQCIVVSANNVTLNCQGFNIDGIDDLGTSGIYISRTSSTTTNVTIKNCYITDWGYCGIIFKNANNNTLTNNTANSNYDGIHFESSSNNNITDNTANDNTENIFLYLGSNYNTLTDNFFKNGDSYGIQISSSSNNNLINNIFSSNGFGIEIVGSSTNDNIINGSITSTSYDYYLNFEGTTNNFTSTNFTSARKIYFSDTSPWLTWFNYRNESNEIWLKNSLSAQAVVTRLLVKWNQNDMKWNESSSIGIIANYSITGMIANYNYGVYNRSTLVYILATDSSGNLPYFTIFLNTTTSEIEILKSAPTPLSLSNNISWSGTYPVSSNTTGAGCPSEITCNLYRNDTLVTGDNNVILGVGGYNYTYNTTGNENYTANSTSHLLTINKGSTTIYLALDGTQGDKSYTYLQTSNATCWKTVDGDSLILYRNGTSVGTVLGNSISEIGILNEGVWNYTCDLVDKVNYTATPVTRWLTVSKSTPGTIDAWYGYETRNVSSSSTINNLAQYDFSIIEHYESFSSIYSTDSAKNWTGMLSAINNSKTGQNMRSAISYYYDGDYSGTTYQTNVMANITKYFVNLKTYPYQGGVAMIIIEVNSSNSAANIISFVNNISQNISAATLNYFPIYVKNFASSSLLNNYVTTFTIPELSPQSSSDFINNETLYMRTNTTLSRFYYSLPTSLLSQAKFYHNNIISKLRGKPLGTATQQSHVAVINGTVNDIVVFNNQSSTQVMVVNISGRDGKDVWDSTNDTLIELDTDGNFTVSVSSYNASIILFEDLDHIQFGTSYSDLFKLSTNDITTRGLLNKTPNDGTVFDSSSINGSMDAKIELWDGSYSRNNLHFTHYEWINTSDVSNYSAYQVIIIADKNAVAINNTIGVENLGKTYGYISVADYADTSGWVASKYAEVNDWIDNNHVNMFLDGLDTGANLPNFEARFKNLTEYVRITKAKKVILNDYTSYVDVSEYGDAEMKESFCGRWGGTVGSPTYTYEDFETDYKRSVWAETLQKPQHVVTYGDINNMTKMSFCYAMWLVLYGPQNNNTFSYNQPNYQGQREIYVKNPGTMLDRSWTNTSTTDYYRAYSKGVVHVNPVDKTWSFDDGKSIENMQVCFELYNGMSTPADCAGLSFIINNNTGRIYNITWDMVAGGTSYVWDEVCYNLTASDIASDFTSAGRYIINIFPKDRADAGSQFNLRTADTTTGQSYNKTGDNSWHDNGQAGGIPITEPTVWYAWGNNKNWYVKLIINSTIKTSVDSIYNILSHVENNFYGGNVRNITLSSTTPYNLTVWDSGTWMGNNKFRKMQVLIGSNWEQIYPSNVSNCDNSSPTWNSTTTSNGEVWKACIKENSTNRYYRFAAPSLSARIMMIVTGEPKWYTNQSSIPTSYSPTTLSQFNVTWNDTPDMSINTVFMESNFSGTPTNYTMTLIEASNPTYNYGVYNYNATLSAGTFYWKSYANASDGVWNTTDTWTFTIGNATPSFTTSVTSPITYETASDYSASESNTGDGGCIYTLLRNGTSLGDGSSKTDTTVLDARAYNYTYYTFGCANYTYASDEKLLTVSQKNANVRVYPETVSIIYPTSVLQYCLDDSSFLVCNIYRNDASIVNGSSIILGVGSYTYKANITDQTNYTNYQDSETLTITKSPTETHILLNDTDGNKAYWDIDTINFTVYVNVSGKTVKLYTNYTGWTLQSGTTPLYNYTTLVTPGTYNATGYFDGDANYSASSETHYFNITTFFKESYTTPNATEDVYVDRLTYVNVSANFTGSGNANYTIPYLASDISSSSIVVYNNTSSVPYTYSYPYINFTVTAGANEKTNYTIRYQAILVKEMVVPSCPTLYTNYTTYCRNITTYTTRYDYFVWRWINVTDNSSKSQNIIYNLTTSDFEGWSSRYNLVYDVNSSVANLSLSSNGRIYLTINKNHSLTYSLSKGIDFIELNYSVARTLGGSPGWVGGVIIACGNGICGSGEDTVSCPQDCRGSFSVDPRGIKLPLEANTKISKTLNIYNSNQSRIVLVSVEGDESKDWIRFKIGQNDTVSFVQKEMSLNLGSGEDSEVSIIITMPEDPIQKYYKSDLVFSSNEMTLKVPVEFSVEKYTPSELLMMNLAGFWNAQYFKFPNEAIPAITGGFIVIGSIVMLFSSISVKMVISSWKKKVKR